MANSNDRLIVPRTIEWNRKKSSRRHVLQWLIETYNCNTMIEIGVRNGGTSFYLLDLFPNLTVYGIDTNISQFYSSEIQEKYGDRLIVLKGMSHTLADFIPDNSIDIIFIDGNHKYEFVRKDIQLYTPKLKKGGLITGHDIDYPGVNQAVTELVKKYDVGPNNVWFKKL